MNKYWASLVLVFFVVTNCAVAQDSSSRIHKKNRKSGSAIASTEGETKFQTHCGRCHNAPPQLSPKITSAVVHHMQVRAMLGQEDVRQILEYLAP